MWVDIVCLQVPCADIYCTPASKYWAEIVGLQIPYVDRGTEVQVLYLVET